MGVERHPKGTEVLKGKRNNEVSLQCPQPCSSHRSGLNKPTGKGAERLVMPPGSDSVPLGFVVFLGLFAVRTINITWLLSLAQKQENLVC